MSESPCFVTVVLVSIEHTLPNIRGLAFLCGIRNFIERFGLGDELPG